MARTGKKFSCDECASALFTKTITDAAEEYKVKITNKGEQTYPPYSTKEYFISKQTIEYECLKYGHKSTALAISRLKFECQGCKTQGHVDGLIEIAEKKGVRFYDKSFTLGSTNVLWNCRKGHPNKTDIVKSQQRFLCYDCDAGRIHFAAARAEEYEIKKILYWIKFRQNAADARVTFPPNIEPLGYGEQVECKCKNGHTLMVKVNTATQFYCKACVTDNFMSTLQENAKQAQVQILTEKFVNSDTIQCQCLINSSHKWPVVAQYHVLFQCPRCIHSTYVQNAIEVNKSVGTIIVSKDFTYGEEDAKMKCIINENHQWTTAARADQPSLCPTCYPKDTQGEVAVFHALNNNPFVLGVMRQATSTDLSTILGVTYDYLGGGGLYRFDYAAIIKDTYQVVLFEFHGGQHYHPTAFNGDTDPDIIYEKYENACERDKQKAEWANKYGIPLLTIPYTIHFTKFREIINHFVTHPCTQNIPEYGKYNFDLYSTNTTTTTTTYPKSSAYLYNKSKKFTSAQLNIENIFNYISYNNTISNMNNTSIDISIISTTSSLSHNQFLLATDDDQLSLHDLLQKHQHNMSSTSSLSHNQFLLATDDDQLSLCDLLKKYQNNMSTTSSLSHNQFLLTTDDDQLSLHDLLKKYQHHAAMTDNVSETVLTTTNVQHDNELIATNDNNFIAPTNVQQQYNFIVPPTNVQKQYNFVLPTNAQLHNNNNNNFMLSTNVPLQNNNNNFMLSTNVQSHNNNFMLSTNVHNTMNDDDDDNYYDFNSNEQQMNNASGSYMFPHQNYINNNNYYYGNNKSYHE